MLTLVKSTQDIVFYIDFKNPQITIEKVVAENVDYSNMEGEDWIAFKTDHEAQLFLLMFKALKKLNLSSKLQ